MFSYSHVTKFELWTYTQESRANNSGEKLDFGEFVSQPCDEIEEGLRLNLCDVRNIFQNSDKCHKY